jgi:hypothetical protein
LQEVERRHQDAARAQEQRVEQPADQSHVVIERQPAHHQRPLARAERLLDHPFVGRQVAVGDHHPLRRARRPRGVLEERQGIGGEPGIAPEVRPGVAQGIDVEQRQAQPRVTPCLPPRHLFFERGAQRADREDRPRLAVGEDRAEARQAPAAGRRIGRHRHRTGIEAAQERGHVVEPRREEQQQALAGQAELLEVRRHRSRAQVEPAVAQALLGRLSVHQEGEGRPPGIGQRSRAEQLHKGWRLDDLCTSCGMLDSAANKGTAPEYSKGSKPFENRFLLYV